MAKIVILEESKKIEPEHIEKILGVFPHKEALIVREFPKY